MKNKWSICYLLLIVLSVVLMMYLFRDNNSDDLAVAPQRHSNLTNCTTDSNSSVRTWNGYDLLGCVKEFRMNVKPETPCVGQIVNIEVRVKYIDEFVWFDTRKNAPRVSRISEEMIKYAEITISAYGMRNVKVRRINDRRYNQLSDSIKYRSRFTNEMRYNIELIFMRQGTHCLQFMYSLHEIQQSFGAIRDKMVIEIPEAMEKVYIFVEGNNEHQLQP